MKTFHLITSAKIQFPNYVRPSCARWESSAGRRVGGLAAPGILGQLLLRDRDGEAEPSFLGHTGCSAGPGQPQGDGRCSGAHPGGLSAGQEQAGCGWWVVLWNQDTFNQDVCPEQDTNKGSISSPSVMASDLISPHLRGVVFTSFLSAGWRLGCRLPFPNTYGVSVLPLMQ